MITVFIAHALVAAALYYLGSRALITQWLWSRYPQRIATFMDCAACSGFWYGFFPALGRHVRDGVSFEGIVTAIVIGLCTLVTTPMLAALMQLSIERLGSAVLSSKPCESTDPIYGQQCERPADHEPPHESTEGTW